MFQDTIQSPKPVFSKQINCSRKELSRISSPFVIFFSSIFDVNSGSFNLTFGLACLLELNQFLGGAEREVGKISNTFVVLYSLTTDYDSKQWGMQMCNLQVCENWLCANLVKFVIHWRRAAGGATIPLDQDQDGAAGLGFARLNFCRWSREWIFDFTRDFLLRSELWNQPLINIILFYRTVVVGSLFTEREE